MTVYSSLLLQVVSMRPLSNVWRHNLLTLLAMAVCGHVTAGCVNWEKRCCVSSMSSALLRILHSGDAGSGTEGETI